MATKKLPYGLSDFRLLQTDDYYYVDKTRFIEEVENSPRFFIYDTSSSFREVVGVVDTGKLL